MVSSHHHVVAEIFHRELRIYRGARITSQHDTMNSGMSHSQEQLNYRMQVLKYGLLSTPNNHSLNDLSIKNLSYKNLKEIIL